MLRGALLFALFLPPLARAAEAPPRVHLAFAVYAAGLNVLDIDSDVDLTPRTYRIDLSYRSAGLFGVLVPTSIRSFVQGGWGSSGTPAPQRFASWGHANGQDRRTVIDYVEGQPELRTLEPTMDKARDPVPEAMQRDTIDTLSAIAMLVRQVADTGRCDGHASVFDGRRLSTITSRTAGTDILPLERRSSYHGPALRCEFQGKQLAGFQHDVSEEELHRIHYSTAWLAPVMPGAPSLPVRVVFNTGFFGLATAYLIQAGPAPSATP